MGYNIPAEHYDYLKGMAEQFGGVGHSLTIHWTPDLKEPTVPCCIWGLAQWESLYDNGVVPLGPTEDLSPAEQRSWGARKALLALGLLGHVSDGCFTPAERKDPNFRLSFDVWAERLGVVRV